MAGNQKTQTHSAFAPNRVEALPCSPPGPSFGPAQRDANYTVNRPTCQFACLLVLLLSCVGIEALAADEAREEESANGASSGNSKLVLGVRWSDPGCADRLERRHEEHPGGSILPGRFRLPSFVRSLKSCPAWDADRRWALSGHALEYSGTSSTSTSKAALTMTPAADDHRLAIDIHVDGSVRLAGTGNSHRVQIESDATVIFHAVKRLYFDNAGVTCLAATCTAESEMVFKEITSRQPKLWENSPNAWRSI